MFIRGIPAYPISGAVAPQRCAVDQDPWSGYRDVLELGPRPNLLAGPEMLSANEFELALARLTDRQKSADEAAAELAAKTPVEPLPDTFKAWERACWGRRPWGRPHHHGWGGAGWGGGWHGGGWRGGRYNSGPRHC